MQVCLLRAVELHKGGVFQIAAEDGVPDVYDNGLGGLGVDNARHMNIQNPLPRIVRPVDLHEVSLEVISNGLIFVRSFAVRRDEFGNSDPLCQFLPQ